MKLTREPVTPLACASSAPEPPGNLTWCNASLEGGAKTIAAFGVGKRGLLLHEPNK